MAISGCHKIRVDIYISGGASECRVFTTTTIRHITEANHFFSLRKMHTRDFRSDTCAFFSIGRLIAEPARMLAKLSPRKVRRTHQPDKGCGRVFRVRLFHSGGTVSAQVLCKPHARDMTNCDIRLCLWGLGAQARMSNRDGN